MALTLSIIVPSHQRRDLLRACLKSVQAHAPASSEILVVDDGSPQASTSRLAASFAGVRVIRLTRRRGFCMAANAGARAASGAIIELLNDDTEVRPGWAEHALAAFANPVVAAVAPLVLEWQPGSEPPLRIDSAGDRYYLGGVAGKRGRGATLGPEYLRPCRIFGASASSAFYRRDVFERVGGFPERFGAYFEDVDLSFRLHWAGHEVRYEPASQVIHHGGASYGTPGRRLVEQQSCNEERVFWRNVPGAAFPAALPRHAAVLVAKAWRRWKEGRLTPFVCGRLRALAEVGPLLRHRRWLHSLGPVPSTDAWQVERRYWGW
jgi:GT2 family glycosyltransferase